MEGKKLAKRAPQPAEMRVRLWSVAGSSTSVFKVATQVRSEEYPPCSPARPTTRRRAERLRRWFVTRDATLWHGLYRMAKVMCAIGIPVANSARDGMRDMFKARANTSACQICHNAHTPGTSGQDDEVLAPLAMLVPIC